MNLIQDVLSAASTQPEQDHFARIKLADILPDPENFYETDGIEELAAAIDAFGLEQPLVVRPADESGKYRLTGGHRRRLALLTLYAKDPERWAEVDVKITSSLGALADQARLILMNRTTRKETEYENMMETVKTAEIAKEFKANGGKVEGKTRTAVAAALGISSAQAGKYQAIYKHLCPTLMQRYKAGTIGTQVAYELSSLPNRQQEEIAAKVAAEVLKPEVMKASFLVADDQEVLAFEAAIQRKCFHVAEDEWNTLEWLNDMGYLVSYSDDYAEVPAEVAAVYDQINTPEFRTLRSQVNWLKDCLIMVSYLYVSAPAKTVYEMFKQRKGFDIGYDSFIELYHTIPEKACICELAGDQLILKSALVNNIYKDIERRQGGRKFYIPSVDEILDYSENGYPTKSASYQRLGRFLLDEMKVSDAVKDQVLFFIYKECSMDGRMSAIMENLNQKGIQFNDEQLEKFTKLIMEANNNTRMLEFRGYTPNEISGAVWPFATGRPHTAMPNSFVPTAMPMQPASARKIYPNDPCPCGSGKKYKKCCGRR